MKRVMVGVCLVLAALAGLVVISIPVIKQLVKRRIVSELRQFIREGSLSVEDISASPKRRQIRLFGVSVKDGAGDRILYIPKVDLDVRRIHHGHLDATARVFEPQINLDAGQIDRVTRLFRMEAFLEKSRVEIDRIDAEGGRLTLSAPGFLASSETMSLDIRAQLEGKAFQTVELHAATPQTSLNLLFNWDSEQGQPRLLDGTFLDFSSTHLALSAPALSPVDTEACRGFQIRIAPADTTPAAVTDIPWNVSFGWGPFRGRFHRLRPAADSPGLFTVDETRLAVGREELACYQNRVEPRKDIIHWESGRWVRAKTGLTLEHVDVLASRERSTIHADFAGRPVTLEAAWDKRLRLNVAAETISIPVLLQEMGESLPVAGTISVRLEAVEGDTPNQFSWNAAIHSADLLAGPSFGKISLWADLEVAGMGTSVEKLSGTVEPAPGVPVQLTGKGGPRGFSGHASLRDRPLKDIQLIGETFGQEIPLVGESGQAGLDVDFTVRPNLEFRVRGRVRIKDATALSKGFPFRVEGLDVDVPFELSPDTGKLVVAEAANGQVDARVLIIGPYRFENLGMKTSSKGDKILTDISPIAAYGGTIRAKLLFHFSEHAHQHAELAVDSVSLKQILAPMGEYSDALSGLVSGDGKFHVDGGDIFSAKGTFWARAVDGPGEPMRVSREFLEKMGEETVRKLGLPKQVPYKNGFLKVRLANGRILFEQVSLDAQTMLRKIRIGKVVGSYMIKDLVGVLSNASSENVKVEIGRKKRK